MTRLLRINIVLLLSFISCCKDDSNGVQDDCSNFNIDVLSNSNFVNSRYQYRTPYFNPNNSSEFVYNYFDFKSQKFQLMTYNMVTNENILIKDDVNIITQPKWSNKNWIAFDNLLQGGYQMSIVKSDGTNSKNIFKDIHNLYPAWGNDGETLYWMNSVNLSNKPIYLFKNNVNTTLIDTVMRYTDEGYTGLARFNDISKNNYLLHTSSCEYSGCIAKTNLNEWPLETESLSKDESILTHLVSLTWGNNDNIIYYTTYKDGLYRFDITTQKTERLMGFCDSKFYRQISYSEECECIVGERVDSYVDWSEANNIFENSSIWLIDLNTMKETQVLGESPESNL